MANSYSVQDYLLDKTNIHDTVTRLTLSFDTKDYAALSRSVYAPDVTIDYTSMFGGQPIQTTSEQWAESLEPMMAPYDSTQHVVTGLLIELPQPAKGASRPNQCTVIANVMGHLVRRSARGGPMMHNGGRYELELIRREGLEEQGENPWRIGRHATKLTWEDGSSDVMASVAGIGH